MPHHETFIYGDELPRSGLFPLPRGMRTAPKKSSIILYVSRYLSGESAGLTYVKYRIFTLSIQVMKSMNDVFSRVLIIASPFSFLMVERYL